MASPEDGELKKKELAKPEQEDVERSAEQESPITRNIWLLIIGLILGAFSIFSASAFRDFVLSIFDFSFPMSERSLQQGGTVLIMYRLFAFFIITALFIIATVIVVSATPLRG